MGQFRSSPDDVEPVHIYILLDPRNGIVRYVGRTANTRTRMMGHMTTGRTTWMDTPLAIWIRELLKENLEPVLQIIETVPANMAKESENWWIDAYAEDGAELLNMQGRRGSDGNRWPSKLALQIALNAKEVKS